VSHAEPWANPSAPLKVLQWLGKEDAPLLFRIRADMRQWLWGLQFLRNCTPARTRHNIEQIVRLGTYSRDTLQQLRRDHGIQYDQRTQGILHFYTNQKEFDGAEAPGRADARAGLRAPGDQRRRGRAHRAGAAHIRPQLAGATFTAEDESGDANQFTRELAKLCEAAACSSAWATHHRAARSGGSIDHVELTTDRRPLPARARRRLRAGHGQFSPLLAQPLGMRLPIYPAKGYSVTMPVKDASMAHQVS
jgi:D-amino-acid dehydrogenase